ncbi:LPS assembly lipoprotein LptE [Geminicoccaceae bacterium 1502E]|nr:LPS assembly lipoprotein LptE [Geminicoccaceae bacterium 1502E]
MLWSEQMRRRSVLALLGLAAPGLAACNLRPLHGGGAGAETNRELAAIMVETPRSRVGQILRNQLLDELNPAGLTVPSVYRLIVRLDRERDALAIQLDDTVTRYDLTLLARFELRRKADGVTLYQGAARRVASYNVVRAPYATLVAEQDAERRAARELSQEIRARLAVQLAGKPA